DDDLPGPDAEVSIHLDGLPTKSGKARAQHFRIDHDHSNAFTVWQSLGSPQQPTSRQYRQLEKAGQLAALDSSSVLVGGGKATLQLKLPRQGVSLLVLDLPR
ncbi:MAG: xylan 1,4-beta-xylosidase, partial [Verrucomicrobiota bacterium]